MQLNKENGIVICKDVLKKHMPYMTYDDIISKCRNREIIQASSLCIYSLRQHGYSLPKIGEITNRHHATIIHLLRVFSKKYSYDKDLSAMFLSQQIKATEKTLKELKSKLKKINK